MIETREFIGSGTTALTLGNCTRVDAVATGTEQFPLTTFTNPDVQGEAVACYDLAGGVLTLTAHAFHTLWVASQWYYITGEWTD